MCFVTLASRNASGLRKGATATSIKAKPLTNGVARSHSTPTLPRIPAQRPTSPGSGRPKSRQGAVSSARKEGRQVRTGNLSLMKPNIPISIRTAEF